ncbi:hypothetical protein FACUT_11316 [Fusarium acutatum]|uniref:Uncharacterized protein n=1 Tax=Fusarium acutatum TaxID=78861 RepID=A0A8H4JDF3_9HYPO|nr:hypothetical protein FACUT_11316 [Fusarium acutatum]
MQNKQYFDIAFSTQADSASSKRRRYESDEPGVHVIFVGISHHKDIGEKGHDCRILCDPALGSFKAADVLGTLTPERLQQLEGDLGPGLVSNIGPKETRKKWSSRLGWSYRKITEVQTKADSARLERPRCPSSSAGSHHALGRKNSRRDG